MPEQGQLDLQPTKDGSPSFNVDDLIGLIAAKHGLMLGKKDPAFVMLTLMESVFSIYVAQIQRSLAVAQEETSVTMAHQVELTKTVAESFVNRGADFIEARIRKVGSEIAPGVADVVMQRVAIWADAQRASAAAADEARQSTERVARFAFLAAIAAGAAAAIAVGAVGWMLGHG